MRNSNEIKIRPVNVNELDDLVHMIHELAAYEKRKPLDAEHLKDNLLTYGFGQEPKFYAQFALMGHRKVGYIFYFFTFSAAHGAPVLYLEDIYVREAYRREKVGSTLFKCLAHIAKRSGCCRVEWGVLKWNTVAQDFYHNLGANILDESLKVSLPRETFQSIISK